MKKFIFMLLLTALFSSFAFAKQFYINTFDGEAIGSTPSGWELGFKGAGAGKIVADPLNPNNKIFAHTDLAKDKARHDVGGSVWTVGNLTWQDYIAEYDAYFPEDFYIGVLFRFVSADEFYLFDRRSAGEAGNFDFWKRGGGNWTRVATGKFDAQPKKWYRFRLVVKGDTFEAYGKSKDDKTLFTSIKPIMTGKDGTFKAGKLGLYGLIYIDNIIIGETEADMLFTTPVDTTTRLPITWGEMKR